MSTETVEARIGICARIPKGFDFTEIVTSEDNVMWIAQVHSIYVTAIRARRPDALDVITKDASLCFPLNV